MSISRRKFIHNMGLGLAAAGLAAGELACILEPRESASEKLLIDNPAQPEPAPLGYDRLPLSWYQAAAGRLRDRAAAAGTDAVLLGSDPNLVYFTGCFRGSGERSTWALFPVDEKDSVYWYSPSIDRELITSWWCTENEYYFCYPHAAGGFPNLGQTSPGARVDLWEWVLEGLKKRGFGGKVIGVDAELSPSRMKTFRRVLPRAECVDISSRCLQMRVIKTPEEIALTQRAYRYFDKIHAFARDYILERGTEATDFEIGQALQTYGINLMMKDVRRDGRPHSAVGMDVTAQYVRTGVATAYPHPNQFFHSRVRKGDALYVNTDVRLGGYGGECYRNYQLAPWTPGQEKMWQVVAECVQIQVEESRPGALCCDIAAKIHAHQVRSGLAECIFHRPAHGAGQNFEGHQPPFIALGDHTALEAGMMFSVEPGLYDAAQGFGINPSDCLLITESGSVLLSRVPYSREWSFLTL